jgi:hypothetical protein
MPLLRDESTSFCYIHEHCTQDSIVSCVMSLDATAHMKTHVEQLTTKLVAAQMGPDKPENVIFIRAMTGATVQIHHRNGRMCDGAETNIPIEQHIASVQAWRLQRPQWEMTMWNVTGTVKNDGRRVDVWFTMSGRLAASSTKVCLEFVQKYSWARRDGSWIWYRMDLISGTSGIWGVHSSLPSDVDLELRSIDDCLHMG